LLHNSPFGSAAESGNNDALPEGGRRKANYETREIAVKTIFSEKNRRCPDTIQTPPVSIISGARRKLKG